MKAATILLGILNVAARVVGVVWVLVGIGFAVSALVVSENRMIYGVVALFLIGAGAAFLLARSIKPSDIERIKAWLA